MTAPSITPEIIAAFRQGASEAAAAWQRAFDAAADFTFGEAADVLTQVSRDDWNAPGLAVILNQSAGAVVLLVADPVGALPVWLATPDASAKSRLATLAQELGMNLLPESLLPTGEQAMRIDNLQEALLRCQPEGGKDALPLTIQHGGVSLPALLLGVADQQLLPPAASPSEPTDAVQPPQPAEQPAPQPFEPAPSPSNPRFSQAALQADFEDGIPQLPPYTRSLLKIQVPVIASLATTSISVGRILEIGPGSIIQFDQSCEQPLSLAVGEHPFAVGEAVKVGEKFGLRITSMVMPSERFWSVRGSRE